MYKLFDIQRGSLVDGPGIRTTVFLKAVTFAVRGVTIRKVNQLKNK